MLASTHISGLQVARLQVGLYGLVVTTSLAETVAQVHKRGNPWFQQRLRVQRTFSGIGIHEEGIAESWEVDSPAGRESCTGQVPDGTSPQPSCTCRCTGIQTILLSLVYVRD